MKIDSRIPTVFFTGKVHVYSDFDGTYCPERHSKMHNPQTNPQMTQYCEKMDEFFKSTKDDLDFHITTGRTFGEYEAVSWLLKMRDYRLPLPDSVIVKNGSSEHIKSGSDADFYDKGIFPFDYNKTSKEKDEEIKELTNWDGKKIKNYIMRTTKKVCLKFIEGDSENSVRDYGNMSLYSKGKLNADEWQKLPNNGDEIFEHENPIADFSIGSRKDGNLKFNLTFPPDYGFCPFRTYVYDDYMNKIRKYLEKNHINYFQSWEPASYKNHHRISTTITPEIDGKELTKLYDTKKAVKEAFKNNDLVIAAGDGSNDFDMLNPLEYISDEEWGYYAQYSENPEFYYGDMRKKLRDLRQIYKGNESEYISELRQELTENGLLKRIEEMPFVGIVINNDNSDLHRLVKTFSLIGKVVPVNTGEIDKGIIIGIRNYAKINPKFKEDMTENLKEIVFQN